jgi:hypothetical protein
VDAAAIDRARRQIPESLAPVRPMAPDGLYASMFLLIAGAVAALWAGLTGVRGLALLAAGQAAAVFGVVLALLLLAAFAVALDMRPGARTVRGVVVFGVAIAATEVVFLALFHDYAMGQFVANGVKCLGLGLSASAMTGVLAWLVLRRGYVVAPVSTGAAVGALAGLAGLAVLELHCPILTVPHIAVWHAGVLAASVGVGALVGKLRATS